MTYRVKLVPAVAVTLACACTGAIVYLQHRMRVSEDARISVDGVQTRLSRLQGMPWQIVTPSSGPPARLRARVAREERAILADVDALPAGDGRPSLARLRRLLRGNFATFVPIMRSGMRTGWRDPARTDAVTDAQNTTLAAADTAVAHTSRAYASDAKRASRMAAGGAAGAIALLVVGFVLYFLRSTRAQRRVEQALERLSAAQEERSRLLARTVEVAEHERIRLAGDLHDGPIQHLTALALNVDRLGRHVERGALDAVPDLIRKVRETLSGEMDSLRRLTVELRPPILDERGLAAALSDAARGVFADTETSWEVRCDVGAEPLAPELETAVYRVVREACVNARKHADASRVEVRVDASGDVLELVVADDGRGFPAGGPAACSPADGHGYGLIGIRERVQGLDGRVAIDGRSGRGTVVHATLPRRQLSAGEAARDLAA